MPEPTPPYRMPAEWEPHAGTWLAWPHRRADWPGRFTPIPWVYGEIVRELSRREPVNILVSNRPIRDAARRVLRLSGANLWNVTFHRIPTDRSWVRDSGPTFVADANGEKVVLDWRFNAWAKYEDWQVDDRLPLRISRRRGLPKVRPRHDGKRVVLEGGSIDVNGDGMMLTTEECLLSDVQCRNSGLGREDYEKIFSDYLGVREVVWLNRGIVGDDTHGHVDDLARFVGPNTVVLAVETNSADENYPLLQENLERLRSTPLEVVTLPMPRPVVFAEQRLPASYANFYIANGCVLVPTFNDPADRVALGTLAELFPDRDVIGIHCVELVWGLGTLHCLTQQEPQL